MLLDVIDTLASKPVDQRLAGRPVGFGQYDGGRFEQASIALFAGKQRLLCVKTLGDVGVGGADCQNFPALVENRELGNYGVTDFSIRRQRELALHRNGFGFLPNSSFVISLHFKCRGSGIKYLFLGQSANLVGGFTKPLFKLAIDVQVSSFPVL